MKVANIFRVPLKKGEVGIEIELEGDHLPEDGVKLSRHQLLVFDECPY